MQRKKIVLLIVLFLLGLMAMTNPSKVEYTSWAKEKAMAKSEGLLEKVLTTLFVDSTFESSTQTSNFVFFTVFSTEISKNEKVKVIGLFHNFIPLSLQEEESSVRTTVVPDKTTETSSKNGGARPPQDSLETPTTAASTINVVGSEGNFELPLIGVEATYGIDNGHKPSLLPKQPLPDLQVNLPADRASQLAVYWVNGGDDVRGYSYIAPTGWSVKSAAIGANGSTLFELISSDQSITYFHAGACFGCTVDYIGQYFPNLYDWALKNSVSGQVTTHPDWNIVPVGEHKVAYSFQNTKGKEVHGVAVESHGEEKQPFFWNAEVVVNDHELATDLLNSFLAGFTSLD
ncbi:DUF4850 domain-containing protein [Tumebacillus lipolyticus]|uniref:DUF4850 domain-containing protein n=1 Tax=Tumebacillus lipolyticus TaxID=1280370 RepID=A0ABW4ZTD0_9BACL